MCVCARALPRGGERRYERLCVAARNSLTPRFSLRASRRELVVTVFFFFLFGSVWCGLCGEQVVSVQSVIGGKGCLYFEREVWLK